VTEHAYGSMPNGPTIEQWCSHGYAADKYPGMGYALVWSLALDAYRATGVVPEAAIAAALSAEEAADRAAGRLPVDRDREVTSSRGMEPQGHPLNTPIKKTKPNKVRRNPPATHQTKSSAALHHGKLYRVRDKDWHNVFGENLTHDKARTLLTKVTGSNKSRTARIEEQTPATQRPSDEFIAQMRAKTEAEKKNKGKRAR
jgi:hypothetical protein